MADKVLPEIRSENYFWLRDGQVLRNLRELSDALLKMDKDTFSHHVNKERNDFYNWVKDVFQQEALAKKILKARTPRGAALVIRKKIGSSTKLKKKIISAKEIDESNLVAHKKPKSFILKRLKQMYHG